ncbi:MAG: peptidase T [Clostridiales bacterium]|nr:peptidase T [Clostridiales bacterium]
MRAHERLLKYVSFDTQSKEGSDQTPSTEKQFKLGEELKKELEALGLDTVVLDEHCYLYGYLPATKGMEGKKALGLIAHMDTAPAFSGQGVKPQIIKEYDGKDILLKGSGELLKVADFPDLKEHKGKTLITTDGTTLLGADDKAGIAEIFTAIEEIISEGTSHGDIWVGITPDEEIGMGASKFNYDFFKADFAYTLDGDYEGELSYENFNAASAVFRIRGKNVHPGSAKDIMINAASIASEIHSMMPIFEVPEHTEGREGFVMLCGIAGDVNEAKVEYILRDHDVNKFQDKKRLCNRICEYINEKYEKDTVELILEDTYFNMLNVMEKHMDVVELGKEAIESIGLKFKSSAIRGGTDGATLTNNGLPCPNLGTGGYAFHGPYEHITLEGMDNAVKIAKYIIGNMPVS